LYWTPKYLTIALRVVYQPIELVDIWPCTFTPDEAKAETERSRGEALAGE